MMNLDNILSSNVKDIFCNFTHSDNTKSKDFVVEAKVVYNGLITENGGKELYEDEDKALLHYAFENYAFWQKVNPSYTSILNKTGIFGENITSIGLTEDNLCIGDILLLGTSKVQVTHGRDACQTMDNLFNCKTMSAQMHDNHKTGWFYKVLEEGSIKVGDKIILLERPNPQWNIALVEAYRYQQKENTIQILETLIDLPYLSHNWKTIFSNRLDEIA